MLPARGGTTGVTGEIRVQTDTGTTSVAVLIDAATARSPRGHNDDARLRSGGFLDTDRHPWIGFSSTALLPSATSWRVTGNLTIENTSSTVVLINTVQLRIDIAAVLARSPDAVDIASRPRHITASAIVSAGLAVRGVVAITGSAPPATVLLIFAATAWPVRRALVDPVKCGPEPNRAGLEQCGLAGFRRWLHNGARAAGDPGRFLTAYRPAGDPRRTCADAPA